MTFAAMWMTAAWQAATSFSKDERRGAHLPDKSPPTPFDGHSPEVIRIEG
jgi:hypothetical protein